MIAAAIDVRVARSVVAPSRSSGHARTRAIHRLGLRSRPERLWCSYCEMPAEGWDHVEPWSQSRDNSQDNLVPACAQCNTDKGDMPLVVFLALTMPEAA